MRAQARVRAEGDGRGGTRLVVLRSAPPLSLRRTGPPGAGPMVVHVVGSAAGPLAGDELRLVVEVGPEADLTVRTVAASVALDGRGASPSTLTVTARVEGRGRLRYEPAPLILSRAARHRVSTDIELAEDADVRWREEVVLGRHGEGPGSLELDLRADVAGRPLLRQQLVVGGRHGWDGPAVLGGAVSFGALLAAGSAYGGAGPGRSGDDGRGRWARLPLDGPGVLATVLSAERRPLGRRLEAVLVGAGGDPGGARPGGGRDPSETAGSGSPRAAAPSPT